MSSFIQQIAPIVQALSLQYGIACNSAVIAQAILESGWGESLLASKYHNYFGIKCGTAWTGASVNLATKEEYLPGTITDIRDNFRAYQSMEEGVRGYFELLQLPRYQNLKGITDPRTYLQTIKDDGYCTSSSYVDECMKLVEQNNLTQYDTGGKTMPKMSDIADRMRYWCVVANLGYCWDHRWDIRDGGETDCSALFLFVLWECGYLPEKPTWGNTDTLRQQLEPLGFKFVKADNSKTAPAGVGLLRNGHVAVSMGDGTVAQASINELGTVRGGQAGDQTGLETKISSDPRNWLWWIYAPDVPVDTTSTNTISNWIAELQTECNAQGFSNQTVDGIAGKNTLAGCPTLRKGAAGNITRIMQQRLISLGYSLPKYGADGQFGSETYEAVRKFQSDNGLTDDGVVGQNTWRKLLGL